MAKGIKTSRGRAKAASPDFKKKLAGLKKEWEAAKDDSREEYTSLPPGTYMCRVTKMELGQSQAGRLQLTTEFTVVQGEESGRTIWHWQGLEHERSLEFCQRYLRKYGVDVDDLDIMQLEATCNAILAERPAVRVPIFEDKNSGFMRIRERDLKVVELDEEDEDTAKETEIPEVGDNITFYDEDGEEIQAEVAQIKKDKSKLFVIGENFKKWIKADVIASLDSDEEETEDEEEVRITKNSRVSMEFEDETIIGTVTSCPKSNPDQVQVTWDDFDDPEMVNRDDLTLVEDDDGQEEDAEEEEEDAEEEEEDAEEEEEDGADDDPSLPKGTRVKFAGRKGIEFANVVKCDDGVATLKVDKRKNQIELPVDMLDQVDDEEEVEEDGDEEESRLPEKGDMLKIKKGKKILKVKTLAVDEDAETCKVRDPKTKKVMTVEWTDVVEIVG